MSIWTTPKPQAKKTHHNTFGSNICTLQEWTKQGLEFKTWQHQWMKQSFWCAYWAHHPKKQRKQTGSSDNSARLVWENINVPPVRLFKLLAFDHKCLMKSPRIRVWFVRAHFAVRSSSSPDLHLFKMLSFASDKVSPPSQYFPCPMTYEAHISECPVYTEMFQF